MVDDPCDEWPVFVRRDGVLCTLIVRELTWLFTEHGEVVSWRRTGEDEFGDTLYRCVIAAPVSVVMGDIRFAFPLTLR